MYVKTVEMHTGGGPVRILLSGFPKRKFETLLEHRNYVREHLDHFRKALILEPRGHHDMYGVIIVPPTLPNADIAVLFMDNSGYSTMCGHAVISMARYAVDHGYVKTLKSPETKVDIQCPCGMVSAYVKYDGTKTGATRFISVPAFVYATDVELPMKKFGTLKVDISYGGGFYVFISAEKLGLDVRKTKLKDLVQVAGDITDVAKEHIKIEFPESKEQAFIYGTILTDGRDSNIKATSINLCVFADRQVDRSPCGSGTTARMALLYHKGLIGLNQSRYFQSSKTGSSFSSKIVRDTTSGGRKAVNVEVSGQGFYLGTSTYTLEVGDKLGHGFSIK
ncbi:hypothetical protein LOTGIDRAFT_118524 [Lottia gigantea]|uniref:trans-L-3-hydroxyproline dehydratase n=1 Tax=Lottia gigantea TaxID=225164 RepID=V4AG66_LOTGI|nr:hypothetical protein LOTGIDRAFT_118524 [Lottia gigantea]ESO94160.1 hypothetical protein LOTGIDRAFT_118524 [Lottia gigantea]